MKKITFACILVSFFAISCSKSDPDPVGPSGTSYMTTTSGSTWTYDQIDSVPVPPDTYTYMLTSTNRDTTVNARSYHVYSNSGSGGSEYYFISGSDYYTYQKLPDALGGTSLELLYLKTNLGVNGTWSQTSSVNFSGFPISITFNNRIAEKGISKIVNGITYTDVIHVETTIAINPFPLPPPTSSEFSSDIDTYYAPKYGLIHSDTKIDVDYQGFVNQTRLHTRLKTTNF